MEAVLDATHYPIIIPIGGGGVALSFHWGMSKSVQIYSLAPLKFGAFADLTTSQILAASSAISNARNGHDA